MKALAVLLMLAIGCASEPSEPIVYNVTYQETFPGCEYGIPRSANALEIDGDHGAWYDRDHPDSRAEFDVIESDAIGFTISAAVNPDYPEYPFGRCVAHYTETGSWYCYLDRPWFKDGEFRCQSSYIVRGSK